MPIVPYFPSEDEEHDNTIMQKCVSFGSDTVFAYEDEEHGDTIFFTGTS